MIKEWRRVRKVATLTATILMLVLVGVYSPYDERAGAQRTEGEARADWVDDIEKVFIRSEDCKQCHDRHYEEWKGAREQTPDLKTFGRVDATLLPWPAWITGIPDRVRDLDADESDT